MKIQNMQWRNFRGLDDGMIQAFGANVTIRGRNGVGKSSIAALLPFVLFGDKNSKTFDDRGFPISERLPEAAIEFDTVTLKRMVAANSQNMTFVNNEKVPAAKFNAQVENLTRGLGTLLFNPFEFPLMHWKDQRDFLLKHFAQNTEPIPDETGLIEKLKQLKKSVADLPGRIEELQKQISETPQSDETIADLELKLDNLHIELAKTKPPDHSREEHEIRAKLNLMVENRDRLRLKLRNVRTICPTCKQKLNPSTVEKIRADIIAEGKNTNVEIQKLQDRLEDLQSLQQPTFEQTLEIRDLQKQIDDVHRRLAQVLNLQQLRKRSSSLREKELTINREITRIEGEIAELQKLRQSRLNDSEEQINSRFKFVKFKLFKRLASGEIKPFCQAMIEGVPFENLSKGERLKASLDILEALQAKFGLEMPLFLDDAESYTPNSLIHLPNQLFKFTVEDCDLRIEVDEI